ncbi:uncharacterized protein LOC116294065 [Actinia tenebrosa]|uniref:Uncharacterized protein LOC116294065 n=1 Tax=Actinia tenebrosa TaxID=6105 RepID=A0A6P8HXQ8_ACTTE|nr:uncharacterized protein LOC116294065 [Actinia tenebrosa]
MSSYLRRGLLHYFKIGSFVRARSRGISTIVSRRSQVVTKQDVGVSTRFSLKQNSKLLTIPGNVRFLASGADSKGVLRQKLWKILRVLFMVTGGIVWGLPAVLYIGFKTGLIKVEVEEREESEHVRHDERLFSVFDVSRDAEHDSRAIEISDKSSALMKIWNKLKLEEGVLKKFGEPVDLIGYQGKCSSCRFSNKYPHFDSAELKKGSSEIIQDSEILDENKKENENGIVGWCVSCIVAGPKQTGILDLEFSKDNKEWIPVSLRLEELQKTGDVVCNVSGPLPNGITRFIRLSND